MRRKDREIRDFKEIIHIIEKCDVCRLAIQDEPYPYIVPLNFGMQIIKEQIYLYFHCANEGTKLDLLKKNNRVSFEMDTDHRFILYEDRMSCTMGYESVIGHGIIEKITDPQEKYEGLKILMRHYHSEDFKFNEKMIPATTVLRLRVLDLTGKRRDNYHAEEKKKKLLALWG